VANPDRSMLPSSSVRADTAEGDSGAASLRGVPARFPLRPASKVLAVVPNVVPVGGRLARFHARWGRVIIGIGLVVTAVQVAMVVSFAPLALDLGMLLLIGFLGATVYGMWRYYGPAMKPVPVAP
jgi:hypothetical protein